MLTILMALALGVVTGTPDLASPGSAGTQGAPADLWIDVVALDREGAPVMDLAPGEFEVWISGYRIPLLDVAVTTPEGGGRTIVLLLDNSTIGPVLVPRVKEVARVFVNLMKPGDRMAVVSLHGDAMELTDDRSLLLRAIDRFRVQGLPVQIEDAGQHVLSTVAVLSRQLAEGARGRSVIVGIGAGWLFDTPLPPPGMRDLRSGWIAAMRAAAQANTSLYVIDPAGLRTTRARSDGGNGFARETGGYAFLDTNDLGGAASRIWQEAGHYYLLGVANPSIQRSAELRELDVRVLRKGIAVRARRAIAGR